MAQAPTFLIRVSEDVYKDLAAQAVSVGFKKDTPSKVIRRLLDAHGDKPCHS